MKAKLLLCISAMLFITLYVGAQVPQGMNYQAIARDVTGNILANKTISVQLTVAQGVNPGTPEYQETHTTTTNQFGLFSVIIGAGTVVSGSFTGITWSTGNVYLNVGFDPNGGTSYADMGAAQMVSVPYALYAETSGGGGTTGATGLVGATGPTGATGAAGSGGGATGATGAAGPTGTVGAAGPAGPIGATGPSGADGAADAWSLTGNAGNTDGVNFIGNTDPIPLNFRVWNQSSGRIEPPGLLDCTSFGYQTLQANASGNYNSAFGYQALSDNTTGADNTAVGMFALTQNVTSSDNTAVGYNALHYSTGTENTAFGSGALGELTNGFQNTAVGVSALGNGNSDYNTAVGMDALLSCTGSGNTAVGIFAAQLSTSGNQNTAVGNSALYNNVTGTRNIAIGYSAGTTGTFDRTISIGNDTYLNAATNQAFIGGTTTVWTGGNVTWSTYSDARVKRNVQDDVKGLDFINRLRPVTYYRNTQAMLTITGNKDDADYPGKLDIEKIKFSGFLAQDVEKAAKEAGYNFSGITTPKNDKELYTLSYEQFVVPLVKGMQEQQQIIANQQQQIATLQKRIDALERK